MLKWEKILPVYGEIFWLPKPMIKKRARWVIGDGRSIKIWEEKWIPSTKLGRIITTRTLMGSGVKVASLIMQERAE